MQYYSLVTLPQFKLVRFFYVFILWNRENRRKKNFSIKWIPFQMAKVILNLNKKMTTESVKKNDH